MSGAVPNLRFPNMGGDWRPARAGDAFRNRRMRGQSGLPIYSVTLDRGMVPRDSLDRHLMADAADGANLRAMPGDLVYNTMRMWQGAVGLATSECMVSPAYVVLQPNDNISSHFFDQWFRNQHMRQVLGAYSHGITSDRLRLYFDDFARIPIHLPSLEEQNKIANFLGAVDDKRDALQRKKSGLEVFKSGMMRGLFSQELRFLQDDGREFPDWEERELSDIGERSKKKNKDLEITRVLTNSATLGVIDQGDYFDKDIANAESLSGYSIVRAGEYVYNPRISVSAPVGPINRNNLADGVMSPLYTVFRINEGNSDFFAQYFSSAFWHDYMKSIANYGARHDRMAINMADFMAMPLPWPHPDEQGKIADALSAMDAKIAAVADQIANMESFIKGLLQQMFV